MDGEEASFGLVAIYARIHDVESDSKGAEVIPPLSKYACACV